MHETTEPYTFLLLAAVAFSIGACVGSFINVLVYRLPLMARGCDATNFNLALPASHCPHCLTPIRALHNIPVIGYLALKGRSACCHCPISYGYPARETIAGLLGVAVVSILQPISASADDLPRVFWSLILAWWLLALAWLAWRHPKYTGSLSQSLLWLGLLANLQDQFAPLDRAIFAVCCCYGMTLSAVFLLFRKSDQPPWPRVLPVVHLTAAGFGWFGFHLLTIETVIVAGICIAALLGLGITRSSSNPVSISPISEDTVCTNTCLTSTGLQASLIIIVACRWLIWAISS